MKLGALSEFSGAEAANLAAPSPLCYRDHNRAPWKEEVVATFVMLIT